ncbi:putative transcription factor B3-Domain family [Helianthus anomalus]
MIHHESQRSWPVYLRSVSGESVIIDGWRNVVRNLQLTKQTLLRLRIMEDKNMKMDCFVENTCVIPEAYVTKCYTYRPVNDCYNIYAAGQNWKVETEKINDIYVFTKGCPQLFHDLGIEDDDILLLMKTDNNTFELKIYRRGVEVVLTNKEESEDDSVMEIPKDTYYKNVQFVSIFN